MADNRNNDEYEFADLEGINPSLTEEGEHTTKPMHSSEKPIRSGNDTRRNALIVVGVVLFAMLVYKFVGSFSSKKSQSIETTTTSTQPVITQTITPTEQPAQVTTVQTATTSTAEPNDNQINQKLTSIDTSQQGLRSDINNMTNQLSGIDSNVSNLNAKIANLDQMVSALSSKLDQQNTQINLLIAARATPVKYRPPARHSMQSSPTYYIQAIIPGRAWLISKKGSTLTVREGTKIAGYGVVKLIDPNQGRVITNSGRVIRFSQQDS